MVIGYLVTRMYLDTFNSHIDKKITFDEFTRDFYFYDYENKEWLGNNPFTKSECDRFWLENEKAMVEICVFTRDSSTDITIHKAIIKDVYETSNDLIKDLMDLDILYQNIIKAFSKYIQELDEEEEECLQKFYGKL